MDYVRQSRDTGEKVMKKRAHRPRRKNGDYRAQIDKLSAKLVAAVLQLALGRAHADGAASESGSGLRNTHRLQRLRSLRTAAEWQIQIETGQVKSRAAIARREGISRAAVTLKLRLLDAFNAGEGKRGV